MLLLLAVLLSLLVAPRGGDERNKRRARARRTQPPWRDQRGGKRGGKRGGQRGREAPAWRCWRAPEWLFCSFFLIPLL